MRVRLRWSALVLGGTLLAAGSGGVPSATGATSVPVVTGTAHSALFSVDFDGASGIAVGAMGQMMLSQDGGKSWQAVTPAPTEKCLLGVAIGSGRTLAVGQSGLIIVRDANGKWQEVASGTEERLFAVSFNATGTAAAVGSFGKILLSRDGGATWTSVAPAWAEGYSDQGMEPHLYDVEVAADGAITVAGEFGLILRSTDAGATWAVLHKGEASIFALDLRADGVGYAVGQGGTILRTTDGGALWSAVASGSTANLLGVRSGPGGNVVVTAMRDMLASADGLAWQRIESGDFSSAWYSGVSVTGAGAEQSVLVVGHSGRIVRIEQ